MSQDNYWSQDDSDHYWNKREREERERRKEREAREARVSRMVERILSGKRLFGDMRMRKKDKPFRPPLPPAKQSGRMREHEHGAWCAVKHAFGLKHEHASGRMRATKEDSMVGKRAGLEFAFFREGTVRHKPKRFITARHSESRGRPYDVSHLVMSGNARPRSRDAHEHDLWCGIKHAFGVGHK